MEFIGSKFVKVDKEMKFLLVFDTSTQPSDFNPEEFGKSNSKDWISSTSSPPLGRGDRVVSQPYAPVLAHLHLPPLDPLQHFPGNLLKDPLL